MSSVVKVRRALIGVVVGVLASGSCTVKFKAPPDPLCGDGVISGDEQCDDSARADGDGCSAACVVEPGWQCMGAPSSCDTLCGDDIRAGTEQCDGADLGGRICSTYGQEYLGGTLRCDADCTFDASQCSVCGDGICEGASGETIASCGLDCSFVLLAANASFNCAVRADGTIWCWGDNAHAQLGGGLAAPYSATPVRVEGIEQALWVDVGGYHACAVTQDTFEPPGGTTSVWCWGGNDWGQAGSVDLVDQPQPVRVLGPGSDIIQVDVGHRLSCALARSGMVLCWGRNTAPATGPYSLGDCGVSVDRSPTPVTVDASGVESISVAAQNGCAVREDQGFLCWGPNLRGQLGTGSLDATCVPTPTAPALFVTSMEMGDHFALAIDSTRQLWGWGRNDWGQLAGAAAGDQWTPVPMNIGFEPSRLGLGWYHACATSDTGDVWCWGRNDAGQVGNGTVDASPVAPSSVVGMEAAALRAVAGGSHTCALLNSGGVACWGDNSLGQLGVDQPGPSCSPVEVQFP